MILKLIKFDIQYDITDEEKLFVDIPHKIYLFNKEIQYCPVSVACIVGKENLGRP